MRRCTTQPSLAGTRQRSAFPGRLKKALRYRVAAKLGEENGHPFQQRQWVVSVCGPTERNPAATQQKPDSRLVPFPTSAPSARALAQLEHLHLDTSQFAYLHVFLRADGHLPRSQGVNGYIEEF